MYNLDDLFKQINMSSHESRVEPPSVIRQKLDSKAWEKIAGKINSESKYEDELTISRKIKGLKRELYYHLLNLYVPADDSIRAELFYKEPDNDFPISGSRLAELATVRIIIDRLLMEGIAIDQFKKSGRMEHVWIDAFLNEEKKEKPSPASSADVN